MKAFDPIIYEYVEIKDWLESEPDNIIIIFYDNNESSSKDKKYVNSFALKKSYLFATSLNDLYVECKYSNNDIFLPKESYNTKSEYFNLGYYINKKLLISNKNKSILDKNKVFYIEYDKFSNFIKKEYIALSYIGIYKKIEKYKNLSPETKKKTITTDKQNIPYDIDVYFEKILAIALRNYSFQWDAAINNYLRLGDSYFTATSSQFHTYWPRFGKTREESIEAIKNKIIDLDRAFLEAGTRNEDDKKIYYRGMKQPLSINNIGENIIVPNFFSITTSYNIAVGFSHVNRPPRRCCLYKIIIDKGVPIIDMINTTKYKNEKEILLPRNLKYTITNIEKSAPIYNNPVTKQKESYNIFVLKASLVRPDQFYIKSYCKEYLSGIIKPLKDKKFLEQLLKHDTEQVSKTSNKKTEVKSVKTTNKNTDVKLVKTTDIVQQSSFKPPKGKRCPNGTRKNPVTGLCENKNKLDGNKPTETDKQKKPRCPNGTRRNPKTGLCEKK